MSDDFTAQFFQHVDASVQQYIAELGEAVAIPSVSADLQTHLKDIIRMEEWTKSYIERLGGTAELLPNPKGVDDDGSELPPILLAEFKAAENSETKKTVCCYAHLDVQVSHHHILLCCDVALQDSLLHIVRVLSLRFNNIPRL
jgi:acetylornithine deacetylase/succinyl-diaminopimelate desuccinylase-like protein